MRVKDDIHVIENVGPGQRTIVRPATGRTWHDWHIEHSGVTLSQMKNIRVILVAPTRTVTMWEFKDGNELNELNKHYNRPTTPGTLSFYFRRPEMQTEDLRTLTSLGTGGLTTLRLEFDIDEAASNPIIKAWGVKSAVRSAAAGVITKITSQNTGGNAEGEIHNDTIDLRDRLAAIHILNNKVDAAHLRVSDATAFNLNRKRTEFIARAAGRVPYASDYGFTLDFLLTNVQSEALILREESAAGGVTYQVSDMRLTVTLGAGANPNVRYLYEYLTNFAGLVGS